MDWLSILTIFVQELCSDPCIKLPETVPPEPPAIVQPVEEKVIQAQPASKCVEVWKPETGLACEK